MASRELDGDETLVPGTDGDEDKTLIPGRRGWQDVVGGLVEPNEGHQSENTILLSPEELQRQSAARPGYRGLGGKDPWLNPADSSSETPQVPTSRSSESRSPIDEPEIPTAKLSSQSWATTQSMGSRQEIKDSNPHWGISSGMDTSAKKALSTDPDLSMPRLRQISRAQTMPGRRHRLANEPASDSWREQGLPRPLRLPSLPKMPDGGQELPRPPGAPHPAPVMPPRLFAPASPSQPAGHFRRVMWGSRQLALGLALVTLVAIVSLTFLLRSSSGPPPGLVSVVSEPSGAEVYLNGIRTGNMTPTPLMEFPIGERIDISVQKDGFISEPRSRRIDVTSAEVMTTFFDLVAVRTLKVVTEPAGASVQVNGRQLIGQTPLDVPELPMGSKVLIQVKLEGYVPRQKEVIVGEKALQVLPTLQFRPAVNLDIETTPDGATVYHGERRLGQTPLYEIPFAQGARITLRVEKVGYKTISRKLSMVRPRRLRWTLRKQRLRDLNLSPDERAEARRIEQAVTKAKLKATRAKRKLAAAEVRLKRVLGDPSAMYGVRARAENEVDKATYEYAEAEQELIDVKGQMDGFRASIQSRR